MKNLFAAFLMLVSFASFAEFDRSNPADLIALKSEVDNDPSGMGYAPVVTSTSELLALLNNPDNNVGGETGAAPMTAGALLNAIWDVAISSQDQFKLNLLFSSSGGLSADMSDFKAEVSDLSTGIANAITTIIRPLSRAEAVFSDIDENNVHEFVTITREDWFAARDYQ